MPNHSLLLLTVLSLAATTTLAEDRKPLPPQNAGGIPDAKDAATLTGTIFFTGKKPDVKPITDIAGNAFCKEHQTAGKIPLKDTFVFGKSGGDKDTLANVLVYVSKGLEGKTFDPPKSPAVLDQVGCMYVPHVVAVMAGQRLEVRNSDDILHNVMASPQDNDGFNFAMPVQYGTNDLVFKSPEMKINTKCFMHPWMSGYIHVLENPFFAVTGPDGSFTIKGLPPGKYTLSVLHEASILAPAPATAEVELKAGETKTADFTYAIKADD